MNIFGRVFGGLLVLVSLGWLASIAGLRPGGLASNQIDSNQQTGTTNLKAPADGKTPVSTANSTAKSGTQVGASKLTTGQTASGQTTPGKPEVEANPRGVGNGTKAVGCQSVPYPRSVRDGESSPGRYVRDPIDRQMLDKRRELPFARSASSKRVRHNHRARQ